MIEASGAPLEPPSGGAVKPVFQELNLRLIFTLRPEFSEVWIMYEGESESRVGFHQEERLQKSRLQV